MIEVLNLDEGLHCSTLFDTDSVNPIIKVIGIGDCGLNAIDYMIEKGVKAAEYLAIDTNAHALARCQAGEKLQIGDWIFQSSSSDTAALEKTAVEDQENIKDLIGDANIVFIVLSMSGRTGAHVAPIAAKIAQPMGQLILAAVAMPLAQHKNSIDYADENLNLLSDNVHSLIVIPDNSVDAKTLLHRAVAGIAEIYRDEGLMPCDLWDAGINFIEAGMCLMGTTSASGTDRAKIAAGNAITNLELQNVDMNRSRRKALVNITSSSSFQPNEVVEVMQCVKLSADVTQSVISAGTAVDETMDDEVRVTVFEFTPNDQNLTAILNKPAHQIGK